MTLSMSDTQHNNALPCAECVYGACRILFTIMLNVVILSVVILSVVMLNVVAPNHLIARSCAGQIPGNTN
jgi:hypothetical protein